MAAEKIEIAKLEFDTTELIKSAAEAQDAFIKLKVEEKELKDSTEDVTESLIKNRAAQKAVKKDINEHSKAIGELVDTEGKLVDVTEKSSKAINKEIKSIDGARKNNKELNSIRNKLNLATKQGRDSLVLMNKKLDENNKFIKENVDQYTKQKIGIGQYEEGIVSALGKVNILGVNLGSVTKQLIAKRAALKADTTAQKASTVATGVGSIGLKVFKIALASTGIGLLLIGLASLVAFFSGTEQGIEAIRKVTIPLKIIWETITGVAQEMGRTIFDAFNNPKQALIDFSNFIKNNLVNRIEGIIELFKGLINLDFRQMGEALLQISTGVEDVIGKVRDLSNETKDFFDEAVKRANEIRQIELQIKSLSASQRLIREQLLTQIKQQELISKNTLKTDKERLDAVNQAERLTKGLLNFETEIIKRKIQKLQLEQESNETLIEGEGSQTELLNLFADLEVKKRESNAIEIKFIGVKNSLLKKQQKNADDFQKKKDKQILKDKADDDKKIKEDKKKEDDELIRLADFEARKTELQNKIDLVNQQGDKEKEELKIEQNLEKKLVDLEKLQLDSDEKLELEKLLKETSENELAKIDIKFKKEQSKRNEDLEKKNIALKNKTFDTAVKLFGAETKLGRAVLAIKEIFALKESLIELKKLTFKSKTTLASANLASAEGLANTAKIGFPQNIPFLIGFATQISGIFSALKSATSLGKSAKFESGGLQEIGGNRHSAGGTKFWGEDGTEFEAEQGEVIGVMSRTASKAFMQFNNLHSKGNYNSNFLQSGGTVARSSSSNSPEDITEIVIEAIQNIPAPIVDVKDIINEIDNRINLVDGANI